jgi:hypothetical protein
VIKAEEFRERNRPDSAVIESGRSIMQGIWLGQFQPTRHLPHSEYVADPC